MAQQRPATAEQVLERARTELRHANFQNYHGITPENAFALLLEVPVEREVLTPEHVTPRTTMWFVLHEFPDEPKRGYTIALDPLEDQWMLVEWHDGSWICDTFGGATMPEALESM